MRLSIWQQFSSNHSANFESVGIFENAKLPHNAAEMLRQKFRAIAQDRTAYEEGCHDCPPTQTEITLAEQYGIEWGRESLDWLILDGESVRNVAELDEFIFVTNLRSDNTWMGEKPIDQLIQHMGGEIIVNGELNGDDTTIEINGTVPSEEDARRLYEQIYAYWRVEPQGKDIPRVNYGLPPWINFWNGGELDLLTVGSSSVEELVKKYLAEDAAKKQYLAEHAAEAQRLTDEIYQAGRAGDVARQDELAKERLPHIHFTPTRDTQHLTLVQRFTAMDALSDTAFAGQVVLSGQKLLIHLRLYKPGRGLPAFVKFLRSYGYTDIQYKMALSSTIEE